MLHRSATAWPPLSRTTPFGTAVVPEVYRMYSGSVAATGTQSAGWAVAISVSQSRSRPATRPGTILGHEAVGTVTATGAGVRSVAEGDRVLLSCISACVRCRFCRAGQYGQCLGGGGWIFGHLIDGVQAEYARVPFADTSTYKVPRGSATSRCCTWPTSWRPGMRSACSTGGSSPAGPDAVHHPPVPAGGRDGRLRHLRAGRRDQRAQGTHDDPGVDAGRR